MIRDGVCYLKLDPFISDMKKVEEMNWSRKKFQHHWEPYQSQVCAMHNLVGEFLWLLGSQWGQNVPIIMCWNSKYFYNPSGVLCCLSVRAILFLFQFSMYWFLCYFRWHFILTLTFLVSYITFSLTLPKRLKADISLQTSFFYKSS